MNGSGNGRDSKGRKDAVTDDLRSNEAIREYSARLMERTQDGDRQAFEELFRIHGEPLVSLAFEMVGGMQRAEELVEEAFLRIYRKRHRLPPNLDLASHAHQVVVEVCSEEPGATRAAAAAGTRGYEVSRRNGNPSSSERCRERSKAEIDRLPELGRRVLLMSAVERRSYREISRILSIPLSEVKQTILAAYRTLREGLRDVIDSESGQGYGTGSRAPSRFRRRSKPA